MTEKAQVASSNLCVPVSIKEVLFSRRGVRGTLIETWISDMMVEDGCGPKQAHQSHIAENAMVDQLLQQLNSGDLRTQVRLGFS